MLQYLDKYLGSLQTEVSLWYEDAKELSKQKPTYFMLANMKNYLKLIFEIGEIPEEDIVWEHPYIILLEVTRQFMSRYRINDFLSKYDLAEKTSLFEILKYKYCWEVRDSEVDKKHLHIVHFHDFNILPKEHEVVYDTNLENEYFTFYAMDDCSIMVNTVYKFSDWLNHLRNYLSYRLYLPAETAEKICPNNFFAWKYIHYWLQESMTFARGVKDVFYVIPETASGDDQLTKYMKSILDAYLGDSISAEYELSAQYNDMTNQIDVTIKDVTVHYIADMEYLETCFNENTADIASNTCTYMISIHAPGFGMNPAYEFDGNTSWKERFQIKRVWEYLKKYIVIQYIESEDCDPKLLFTYRIKQKYPNVNTSEILEMLNDPEMITLLQKIHGNAVVRDTINYIPPMLQHMYDKAKRYLDYSWGVYGEGIFHDYNAHEYGKEQLIAFMAAYVQYIMGVPVTIMPDPFEKGVTNDLAEMREIAKRKMIEDITEDIEKGIPDVVYEEYRELDTVIEQLFLGALPEVLDVLKQNRPFRSYVNHIFVTTDDTKYENNEDFMEAVRQAINPKQPAVLSAMLDVIKKII